MYTAEKRKHPFRFKDVLTRTIRGCEPHSNLSFEESIKYGEAIVLLRSMLGEFGDVNAFDTGVVPVPLEAKPLFILYREHANALAEGNIHLISRAFQLCPMIFQNFQYEDLQDIVGVAQGELLRSAKRYNPWHMSQSEEESGPIRFSTYAVGNMHYEILNAASERPLIHVPREKLDQYYAYIRTREVYDVSFKEAVSIAEFIRIYKRFPEKGEEIKFEEKDRTRLYKEYAHTLLVMHPFSLEEKLLRKKPSRSDRFAEISYYYPSIDEVVASDDDVVGDVMKRIDREQVHRIFDVVWPVSNHDDLTSTIHYPKQRQVLEMSLGFFDGSTYTDEEIGTIFFGCTHQAVQAIRQRAFEKLRSPEVMEMLKNALLPQIDSI